MEPEYKYTVEDFWTYANTDAHTVISAAAALVLSGSCTPEEMKERIKERLDWQVYDDMYVRRLEDMPLLMGLDDLRNSIAKWRLAIGK